MLRGRYPYRGYPKLFDDPTIGEQARELFADAQTVLEEIIRDRSLTARGIVGTDMPTCCASSTLRP